MPEPAVHHDQQSSHQRLTPVLCWSAPAVCWIFWVCDSGTVQTSLYFVFFSLFRLTRLNRLLLPNFTWVRTNKFSAKIPSSVTLNIVNVRFYLSISFVSKMQKRTNYPKRDNNLLKFGNICFIYCIQNHWKTCRWSHYQYKLLISTSDTDKKRWLRHKDQ